MQLIQSPIATWCVGQACSMASLLLCAGTEGMRHSLPNSRIMLHQPSGQASVSTLYSTSTVKQPKIALLHIPDLIVKLCVFVPFIYEFFPYDGQYGNEIRIFAHSRFDCKIMCFYTFYK
jgi:hypothetical protein